MALLRRARAQCQGKVLVVVRVSFQCKVMVNSIGVYLLATVIKDLYNMHSKITVYRQTMRGISSTKVSDLLEHCLLVPALLRQRDNNNNPRQIQRERTKKLLAGSILHSRSEAMCGCNTVILSARTLSTKVLNARRHSAHFNQKLLLEMLCKNPF
jgi:hypothetical protein